MSTVSSIRSTEELEWQLRLDMAAVFRTCARLGMNEQIGNHNSLMLPGDEKLFLINPRGSAVSGNYRQQPDRL